MYHLFLLLYNAGIHLLSPWNTKAALWIKGRKKFPKMDTTNKQTVWMHCASLGEFEQGRPILESIRKEYPGVNIVLTFFSPSGYEIMKGYNGADYIFYLPVDSKANAIKMIDTLNPSLVLWVKYEFWYYYLTEFKKRHIPILMVSGIFREHQPFFKWYGSMWKNMLHCFTYFFVQNEVSKDLLSRADIHNNVALCGDTRFDRVIDIAENMEPLPLIEKFCGTNKVIVAGSTWEEDETELVHYVKTNPQIKFIIAPHEIDAANLKDVKKKFPHSLFYAALVDNNFSESTNNTIHPTQQVLIIDNIGMLSRLYHYAAITYIGGGFGSDGIHNVLEAAVYGKPVIFGPTYEKFAEAVGLIECGAGISIDNALELENELNKLWNNETVLKTKSKAAKKYVYEKAGATQKIMEYIQANLLLTS